MESQPTAAGTGSDDVATGNYPPSDPKLEEELEESKESALRRYFLHEWEDVKRILSDIVSENGVTKLSDVNRIRSIVCSLSLLYSFSCYDRFLNRQS